MTGTLHGDQYTFLIVCRLILLRIRNVSDRSCTQYQNTQPMFSNFFFENCTVYEIMWTKIAEPGRPHMTIWRMSIACCITKGTDTHSKHVIVIAFPLQKWLCENASLHCELHTHEKRRITVQKDIPR